MMACTILQAAQAAGSPQAANRLRAPEACHLFQFYRPRESDRPPSLKRPARPESLREGSSACACLLNSSGFIAI